MIVSTGSQVGFLINFIIETYLMNYKSILICYDSKRLTSIKLNYLESVSDSLHKFDIYVVHWIDVANLNQIEFQEKILENVNLGSDAFITILPNTIHFIEGRYYANENQFIRQQRTRYLFLSEEEDLVLFFQLEPLKLFPEHIVIQPEGDNFKLTTQKYVGVDHNEDVEFVDIFFPQNKSFLTNRNLYYDKLKNLEGRILKIGAPEYPPYLLVNPVPAGTGNIDSLNDTSGTKNLFYDGAEGKISLEFCKLRNCTMKAYLFGREGWGDILEDGSSHLSYGSLYQKQTEFVIGCVTNWYPDILESSVAIAKSGVKIMGPKPLRYPPALTPILPFSGILWTLFFLTMVLSTIVLFGFRYFSKVVIYAEREGSTVDLVYQSLFEVLAIFFQNCYEDPKYDTVITRMILAVLLVAAMTIENTYSGQLKSVLTVPVYLDPVDTIEKFTKTEWHWAALTMEWVNSIHNSDLQKELIMTKKFKALDFENMYKMSLRGDYGFAVEKLTCGKFYFGKHIQDCPINNYIMLKDELFFYYTQGLAIRGWPLIHEFNKVAEWCVEHGLYLFWESQYTDIATDTLTQQILLKLEAGHVDKDPPEVIRVSHIAGIVYALIFGYLIAFMTLLIEICCKKFSKEKKLNV